MAFYKEHPLYSSLGSLKAKYRMKLIPLYTNYLSNTRNAW